MVGIFLHAPLLKAWDLHGTKIENIIASNFIMQDVRMGFCFWHFPEDGTMDELQGYIRNVQFSNLIIAARDYSYIGGKEIKGVALDNIKMTISRFPDVYKGRTPIQPPQRPSIWGRGCLSDPITLYPGAEVSLQSIDITEK